MTTDAHKGLWLEGALGLRCHSKVKIANLTNSIHVDEKVGCLCFYDS